MGPLNAVTDENGAKVLWWYYVESNYATARDPAALDEASRLPMRAAGKRTSLLQVVILITNFELCENREMAKITHTRETWM